MHFSPDPARVSHRLQASVPAGPMSTRDCTLLLHVRQSEDVISDRVYL